MNTKNPYLLNNFAPVHREITADKLKVIGHVPPELNGMYVRNGPNPQFTPLGHYHWFDGDGMLHAICLRDGEATYFNRYVQTQGLQIERQQGKAQWPGLQGNATYNLRNILLYGLLIKNTANTALVYHAGRLLALWEMGKPYEIATDDLTTVGPYTFGGKLQHNFTAHPKVDPVTGEMMFLACNIIRPPYLRYGVVSAVGEIQQVESIPLPNPVLMHDFAITEQYTIFMDLPLIFSRRKAVRSHVPFRFDPTHPTRFGIMPRHGNHKNLRWFDVQPCYVYHTLNAYEQGDEVVVIGCRVDDTNLFQDYPPREQAYLYRWCFNLKTGLVREGKLDDVMAELPRVNDNYVGQPVRYGYMCHGTAMPDPDNPIPVTALLKYDLTREQYEVHNFGYRRYGGEAVYVPRPNANQEDDGWLLSFVHDIEEARSELLILHAQDVSGEAVARILLPQRVPYGFHGIWVDGRELDSLAVGGLP